MGLNDMNKIVVCDIGGTNSRFAIFSRNIGSPIRLESEIWQKTNNFESFEDLLSELDKKYEDYNIAKYQNFVVAVPGPIISEDTLSFPNVKWTISKSNIGKLFPDTNISFINDFIAQAYGCLTEASDNAMPIIAGKYTQHDIAIIGAGTGTGHGAIKKISGGTYLHLPSEAGHITFPFIGNSEFEFRDFLIKKTGNSYPVCNNVVSGPGLSLLHQFFTGKKLEPHEVAKEINIKSETTEWFSMFYARCCKNYTLTILASGGQLFVSGGVAIKNPFLIDNDIFRNEFINCPSKLNLLKSIPVYLNRNEKIGLWGAAYYAFEAKNNHSTKPSG